MHYDGCKKFVTLHCKNTDSHTAALGLLRVLPRLLARKTFCFGAGVAGTGVFSGNVNNCSSAGF